MARRAPALVLAFPVGFVGAAEAKEALIEHRPRVPYIALRGRRGGSALAAAAVNALALEAHVSARPEPGSTWSASAMPGSASLSATARAIVEAGEVLVGGERHLAMVPEHTGRAPALALSARGDARRPRGAARAARRGAGERRPDVVRGRRAAGPALRPRASCACCRRRPRSAWSAPGSAGRWREVACLSAHSRPLVGVRRHLAPGARLVVLEPRRRDAGRASPACSPRRGFGPSRLWVFEHLDGPAERRSEGTAAAWPAAELRGAQHRRDRVHRRARTPAIRARTPGLPDEAFESDGMLTKREVRAATLARLMPLRGAASVGRRRRQRRDRDRVAAGGRAAPRRSPSSRTRRAAP